MESSILQDVCGAFLLNTSPNLRRDARSKLLSMTNMQDGPCPSGHASHRQTDPPHDQDTRISQLQWRWHTWRENNRINYIIIACRKSDQRKWLEINIIQYLYLLQLQSLLPSICIPGWVPQHQWVLSHGSEMAIAWACWRWCDTSTLKVRNVRRSEKCFGFCSELQHRFWVEHCLRFDNAPSTTSSYFL